MSELRKDPVIGRWVIISGERGRRPSDFPAPVRRASGRVCPFCPGNEALTPPEILAIRAEGTASNTPGWRVRAISNKYPALTIHGELNREGVGIFDKMNGVGAHEVVIETAEHNEDLADMTVERVAEVLSVCQERVIDLERDPRFRFIMLFKNNGASAGASLEHSHMQLIATPVVPKRVIEELDGSRRYYDYKERCIFCDIVRQELKAHERVVDETPGFVTISPFAARFPYETWVLPRSHQPSFRDMSAAQRAELALILSRILRRLKYGLNDPDYNLMLHTTPVGNEHDRAYHWHIELMPKLTHVAGFEWGTGFYINPTAPEEAAEYLRSVPIERRHPVPEVFEAPTVLPAGVHSGRRLNVFFLSSEVVPFSKTGGLADVAGALPEALAELDCDVTVVTPHQGKLLNGQFPSVPMSEAPRFTVQLGGQDYDFSLRTLEKPLGKVRHLLVENPGFFGRPALYVDPLTGRDYVDNDERFAFFCRGILEWIRQAGMRPDIIHLNDWQTAPAAAFMGLLFSGDPFFTGVRSILTIHNLAYQGMFPAERFDILGLDPKLFHPLSPFEFWGKINYLKSGLICAHKINTVSPTYAREIQTDDELGCGLNGILSERANDLSGILNGIDTQVWNPATDHLIPQTYDAENLAAKHANKETLCARAGIARERWERPLIGIISRLADQKGFDLIADAAEQIFALDVNVVLLGTGERRFHDLFTDLQEQYPGRMKIFLTFDDALAHTIEAGADIFLMPSRYEPCGLNQMYSLRYGTVPVVRSTGGLADTVIDADANTERGNGFSFREYTADAMLGAIRRAVAAYNDPSRWTPIQIRGMAGDFSWRRSAQKYIALYESALGGIHQTMAG